MENIDFTALSKEITDILEKEELMVLATTSGDKVTARTICHVNDGLDIYFGTSNTSQKYEQINANHNVAFVLGNKQIEAVATICGHPSKILILLKCITPNSLTLLVFILLAKMML